MRLKCFQILELIIGWKNYYWVLCLSGAFVFKRHFTFFLVYYAAFSGVYFILSDCHFTSQTQEYSEISRDV